MEEYWEYFSAQEKRIILEEWQLGRVSPAFIKRLAQARARTAQKAASDARTDRARRTLVGARVPRELAEKVKEAAEERGVSVYRLVVELLEQTFQSRKTEPELEKVKKT